MNSPINASASVRIRLPKTKRFVSGRAEKDVVLPTEHDVSDGVPMATKNDAL